MQTDVVVRPGDGPGGAPAERLGAYLIRGGVNLFVYPTPRFKTSLVNILLSRPLDTDTAGCALLPFVLRRGTRRLPDMAAVARHLENLFGASIEVDVSRIGERQILLLRAEVVEDRYLFLGGHGLLQQAFELLGDILRDPALEDGRFPDRVFQQERTNLKRFVEGLANDRTRYAFDRCVRIMCEGEAYARLEYGDPEEIDAVTPERLAELWGLVLARASAEIYVVSSVGADAVREGAERVLGGDREGTGGAGPLATPGPRPRRVRRVRERAEVSQARLVLGYRTQPFAGHPSWALAIMNTVFGGGPYSRLFREVRERHSLAYYCSSSVDQLKGVCFVQAGVDAREAARVEDIVGRQLTALRRGRFSEEELAAAREHLRGEVLACADSPPRIAGFFSEQRALGGAYTFAEALAAIERVGADEVVEAARSFRLDTVYLLARGRR